MIRLILLFLLLMPIALSQPFGPPLYIANPETGECGYYFAGDPKHFNARPENFTINLGYTTDFENVHHACNLWKCSITDGLWRDECYCPKDKILVNGTGCVYINETNLATGSFLSSNKSSINSFIFSFLISLLLLYIIFLNFRIRRLRRRIIKKT